MHMAYYELGCKHNLTFFFNPLDPKSAVAGRLFTPQVGRTRPYTKILINY